MGKKKSKRYSAQFKFTVGLEALKGEKGEGEIAWAYEVHPVTLSRWKKQFLEHGAEVLAGILSLVAHHRGVFRYPFHDPILSTDGVSGNPGAVQGAAVAASGR